MIYFIYLFIYLIIYLFMLCLLVYSIFCSPEEMLNLLYDALPNRRGGLWIQVIHTIHGLQACIHHQSHIW